TAAHRSGSARSLRQRRSGAPWEGPPPAALFIAPANVHELRAPDAVARLGRCAVSDPFASVHRHPERKAPTAREEEVMTVIDLQEQRKARRRARFEEFCAAQERALAETTRVVDKLVPLIEQSRIREEGARTASARPHVRGAPLPRSWRRSKRPWPKSGATCGAARPAYFSMGCSRRGRGGRRRTTSPSANTSPR